MLYRILRAVIVALSLLFIYLSTSINIRGGRPETYMILPIFVLAMSGNFYEEELFRGYFQGALRNM